MVKNSPQKYVDSQKKCELRVRLEALIHYSKSDPPKCCDCGDTTFENLRIAGLLPGLTCYMLRKRGWPGEYKVRCWTCVRKARAVTCKTIRPELDPETGKHINYQREEVNCAQCGATLIRKQCHLAKYERAFCDVECHGKWKAKHLRGKKNHRFIARVVVACTQCGKEKKIRQHAYETNKNKRFFCNRACQGLWKSQNLFGDKLYNWVGGYQPYYGPSWSRAKQQARIRDKNTCQRCRISGLETGKRMDVHHIIPFRLFGIKRHRKANALANLKCYCASCHKIVELESSKQEAVSV